MVDRVNAQTCTPPDISVGVSQSCPTITQTGNINSITNSGSIGSSGWGIYSQLTSAGTWTLGTITNNSLGTIGSAGLLYGMYLSGTSSSSGVAISNTIGSINNAGIFRGSDYGIVIRSDTENIGPTAINNSTNSVGISSITNSGSIIGGSDYGFSLIAQILPYGGTGNIANAFIGTLTNSNLISGISGIFISGNSNANGNTALASIGTLTNTSTGTITGTAGAAIVNGGLITTINNAGTITGTTFGIDNGSVITTLNNSGSIGGISNEADGGTITTLTNTNAISGISEGVLNAGTISTLNNSGSIVGATSNWGIYNSSSGSIGTFTNSSGGVITGPYGGLDNAGSVGVFLNAGSINGIWNEATGTITTLNNYGSIGAAQTTLGLDNFGHISTLNNLGSMIGGVNNRSGGIIGSVVNTGAINGANNSAITNASSIGTITNSGSMYNGSGWADINNTATGAAISTLNNGQGVGNTHGALNYAGALPTNYNIIINSPTNYGQLNVLSGMSITGATTFGIYGGGVTGVAASTLNKGTYSSVLSGVAASNLTGLTKGAYGGLNWSLSEVNVTSGIWNLIVNGATTADTQQSLVNTASALQNTFILQNTVLANSFSYDCNIFGENDVCVSAGGRNTAVSAANGLNNTSALLIAAYRVMPSVRIGAYADQNLSVNNAGSTVNLGNNTPLIGLFGAWNENLDGTGTEVKVSAAYGQKNTTVTRQVVNTSEPGTGSSSLNSQGAQVDRKSVV